MTINAHSAANAANAIGSVNDTELHIMQDYFQDRGEQFVLMTPAESTPEQVEAFRDCVKKAREVHATGTAVDVPSRKQVAESTVLVSQDGLTGCMVTPAGRLNAMFRLPGATATSREVIASAVVYGANHLSCLDTFLPEMYAEFGFMPVYRQKFDITMAPDWDREPFYEFDAEGTPDSVKMERVEDAMPGEYRYAKGDTFGEQWSGIEWWA